MVFSWFFSLPALFLRSSCNDLTTSFAGSIPGFIAPLSRVPIAFAVISAVVGSGGSLLRRNMRVRVGCPVGLEVLVRLCLLYIYIYTYLYICSERVGSARCLQTRLRFPDFPSFFRFCRSSILCLFWYIVGFVRVCILPPYMSVCMIGEGLLSYTPLYLSCVSCVPGVRRRRSLYLFSLRSFLSADG